MCEFEFWVEETDGSFDPDDGHQHGTACMGMAAATVLMRMVSKPISMVLAPNALVDVRIGTDAGGVFRELLAFTRIL